MLDAEAAADKDEPDSGGLFGDETGLCVQGNIIGPSNF